MFKYMARGISVGLLPMRRTYTWFSDIARSTGLTCPQEPLGPRREWEFLFIRASKLITPIPSVPCASPQNVGISSL